MCRRRVFLPSLLVMLMCLAAAAQDIMMVSLKDGSRNAFSIAMIDSVNLITSAAAGTAQGGVPLSVDYHWRKGGIRAATGVIYDRDVRVYSELIAVEEGDVIKSEGWPYTIVYYHPADSSFRLSDYTEHGFRNRDFLFAEKSLIRLLVARPDFGTFSDAELTPPVWVQHGGYQGQVPPRSHWPRLFDGQFGLEAHRGICDEYPENTLLSFRQAASVGHYRGMETDAQMTRDGVLVCMHDKSLDRTTDGTGKVSDYTWAELQQVHIDGGYGWDDRYGGQLRIPTFAEYLDVCKESGKVPYVELKLLTGEGIAKVIDLLHDKGFADGTYVLTSFTLDYLLQAASLCDAPLELMMSSFSDADVDKYAHLRNILLRPQAKNVTERFVKDCHFRNIGVEAYGIGVGDKATLEQLRRWGVEGGTCNSWKGLGWEEP